MTKTLDEIKKEVEKHIDASSPLVHTYIKELIDQAYRAGVEDMRLKNTLTNEQPSMTP